eukprot:265274_1
MSFDFLQSSFFSVSDGHYTVDTSTDDIKEIESRKQTVERPVVVISNKQSTQISDSTKMMLLVFGYLRCIHNDMVIIPQIIIKRCLEYSPTNNDGSFIFGMQSSNLNSTNAKENIYHLIHKLITLKTRITDINLFWKQIGFQLDNQLIQILANHPSIWKQTNFTECYNDKRYIVFERLIEELEISSLLGDYGAYFLVDTTQNGKRVDKLKQVLYNLPAYHIGKSNSKFWRKMGCTINNNPELLSLLQQNYNLLFEYCQSYHYDKTTILQRLIEELKIDQSSILMNLYILLIPNSLSIIPIVVHCKINTSGIKYNQQMIGTNSDSKIIIAKNGIIEHFSDRQNGFISLHSKREIIINGCLKANIICLTANGKIINNGKIICNILYIDCSRWEEIGTILPCDDSTQIKRMISMKCLNYAQKRELSRRHGFFLNDWSLNFSYVAADLSIYAIRGYATRWCYEQCQYHPKNLLSNDSYRCYKSADEKLPNDDWIIFEIKNAPIIPTTIEITNMNEYSRMNIKQIAVFIGKCETDDINDAMWYRLCNNIANIKYHDLSQKFHIGSGLLLSDYFIYCEKLNLIKIKILANHGDTEYNSFKRFSISGGKCMV